MDKIIKEFHLQTITPVSIIPPEKLFCLDDRFFFIGSCFSEYLYTYLKNNFFTCMTSPFGNIYNPFSITSTLLLLLGRETIHEDDIFEHNGLFRHFAFHTKVCKPHRNEFITYIDRLIHDASLFLKKASLLIITFGTAFAYFYSKTKKVVNNCHTLPASEFSRRILSIDEITGSLEQVLSLLKERQKKLSIIFTLSPVRYLRDKAEDNSLSKAVLRCAIDTLLKLPDTYYFPSYEIMLDELRDYRYYKDDLCHPDEIAVRYIMNRFCESCLDSKAGKYLEKITRLRKALMHKPIHPDSEEYRKFLKVQQDRLTVLCSEYPGMPLPVDVGKLGDGLYEEG